MNSFVHVRRPVRGLLAVLLLLGLLPVSAISHVEPAHAAYTNRFSTLASGAITFTGNTLGLSKQNNANAPGTADGIGTFIGGNAALRENTYPLGTTGDWRLNRSSAQLTLPPGSSVRYAELIWSGSYSYGGEDVGAALDTPIQFATPNGLLHTITRDPATSATLGTPSGAGACVSDPDTITTAPITPCFYVRSANVTALVAAAGAGAYSVGGVPATQGDRENSRNNAGWTLAVVYANPALPARNLTLFVGQELTNLTTSTPVTVDGFCTPPSGSVSGRLLLSAAEGDANRAGDQMQFGQTIATLAPISGPNNPINNFFASQINADSGVVDTGGSFGTRNQNAAGGSNVSGGRQGWDITNVDISATLANQQTSAVARGTTNGDQYVINALATQINIGAPNFPPDAKSVDKPVTFVGDTLTYRVRVENTGSAEARNVLFTDALPPGLSLVPGSFSIDGVAVPGANLTAGVPLGNIPIGALRQIVFQARVDSISASYLYANSASWSYDYISCAGQSVLPGTVTTNQAITRIASIEPLKSVLPTGPAGPGQALTYEIRVPNLGSAPTAGTTLVDAIPAGTSYVAGSTTLNGAPLPDLAGGLMPFTQARLINSPGAPPGQIGPGASAVVTFRVLVGPGVTSLIENIAIADEDGPGPRPPKPARAFNAVVNLAATKADALAADTAPPGGSPGDTIGYTITITNRGSGAATNVRFNDAIPAHTSYVGASTTLNGLPVPDVAGAMPFTNGQLVNSPGAPPGQIGPGASAVVAFRVRVDNPIARGVTQVANQGTLTSSEQPALFTDDPATPTVGDPTITPIAAQPALAADKAARLLADADANGVVSPGDTLRYSITIANAGNTEAAGVVYTDTPDLNTTLVPGSLTTTQGQILGGNAGSPPIVVAIGSLPAPSGRVTITYDVVVVTPLPVGVRELVNQGIVTSSDVPAVLTNDPSTPQPGDPTRVPVRAAPALTADKIARLLTDADGDQAASPGDTLIYQVTIRNAGNTAAIGVLYTDAPDPNTTLVPGSVQTSAGSILSGNAGAPPVRVQIGTLAVGSSVTISYRTTINNPLPAGVAIIENQGLLTSDNHPPVRTNDPTTPNPGDPTTVPVTTRAELAASKVDALLDDADRSGAASPGDLLLYQIVVRSIGNTAALTITLDDAPDANTTLIAGSVQSSHGTVTQGNRPGDTRVQVSIGALPGGGGSATISFRVRINSPLPPSVGQVANQGLINSGNAPAALTDDPDTPAPADPTVTPITQAPQMSIEKTADLALDADGDGRPSPGDTLRYTIVARNTGNGLASQVTLDDTPDSNTTLVAGSVTSTLGTVTRGNAPGDRSVGVDVGDLPSRADVTIAFQVRIHDPLPDSVRQVANQGLLNGNFPTTPSDDPRTPQPGDPTITPLLRVPQLVASKTDRLALDADGDGHASPGDILLYQITLRNTGSATATGVVFTDVPDVRAITDTQVTSDTNLVLVAGSVQASQGSVLKGNRPGDRSIAIAIGNIPARGGLVTISFQVRVRSPLPSTVREVSNQGLITGNFPSVPTDDPDTPAPGDPTITPVRFEPRIGASKLVSLAIDADNNGRVTPGDTLQYLVIITNSGNAVAQDTTYTDTPDPNTTLVPGSVRTSIGTVVSGNTGAPPVRVAIGELPPGRSVVISYRTRINRPLPASVTRIENQGLAEGTNFPPTPTDDPTTPTPGDPTRTPLTPTPVLVAEKADYLLIDANRNGKPSAGDTLIYLITIGNRGLVVADNVVFSDNPTQFFSNVIFQAGSVVTSQGTVLRGNSPGDTTIEIAIGSVPQGASVRINFEVLVKNPVSPPLVRNQGLVRSPGSPDVPTDDPDTPAPNDPTTTIIPPGDITAVQLLSFSATRQDGGAAVRWATGAELNTWGFVLYRSADAERSHAIRITPAVIFAQGRGGGARYEWIDSQVMAGTIYYYWLQEIELNGALHEYGPAVLQ